MNTRNPLHRKVLYNKPLPQGSFILGMERKGLEFFPGQHISLGKKGDLHMREYSLFSNPQDSTLEVLVKVVPQGLVSNRLATLEPGDEVYIEGPFGQFGIQQGGDSEAEHIMVASGTGISPFHSMVSSWPNLNYRVLHGVRTLSELYGKDTFDPTRYLTCVSREDGGTIRGRVTQLLPTLTIRPDSFYYLCGNCDMIYDVYDILRKAQVPTDHIFTEVYF